MGRNPESIGDMEIYDIVTDMNRIPFIQTNTCCRGHIINPKINYKSPYMFFYFSDYEKGVNLSNTIFEKIQNHFKQEYDSNIFTEIRMGGYMLSLENDFSKKEKRKAISDSLKKVLPCVDNIFIYSKLFGVNGNRFKSPDRFDKMTADPIQFHFNPKRIKSDFKEIVEREVQQYVKDTFVNIDWSSISGSYMINGEILNRRYKRGIAGYMSYQDAIKEQGVKYHEAVERDIMEFWDAFKTGIKKFNEKSSNNNSNQPF